MLHYILGAPGSGKSLIAPRLRKFLPSWVVLDWDALMGPAGELAGIAIPRAPQTWESYGRLVRAVTDLIQPTNMVVLGVCTPDEMTGWPNGPWILLDCSDDVRQRRLAARGEPDDLEGVLADAADYRTLGLPVIDTTQLSPDAAARAVADKIVEISVGP